MKKILFVLLILLIPGCFALTFDMKENYAPAETLVVKISGNIVEPINKDQVIFRRGHVAIAPEYDIARIGEDYFVWAVAPSNAGNYTLVLKDVIATEAGNAIKKDWESNFSVSGNIIDYSVNPGFINTKTDFSIRVVLNEDRDKEVPINFPGDGTVILHPGENILKFSISDVKGEIYTNLKIGNYDLPAHIIGKPTRPLSPPLLDVRPAFIESVIYVSKLPVYPVEIINLGESETPFSVSYDTDLFLVSPVQVESLKGGERLVMNVTLKKTGSEALQRNITVNYGNYSVVLPFNLRFTSNASEASTISYNTTRNYSLLRCSEIPGGRICTNVQTCSGTSQNSIDGSCCLSQCIEETTSRAWIGYSIGGILILVLIFIFLKYRKVKAPNTFRDRVLAADRKFSS
ncbi:hypothetical protein KW787_00285 [Candidatus Pacearchaeota archaeon]|nr:hypothetical protein [Candidatus Pacearchaeota archaeon]